MDGNNPINYHPSCIKSQPVRLHRWFHLILSSTPPSTPSFTLSSAPSSTHSTTSTSTPSTRRLPQKVIQAAGGQQEVGLGPPWKLLTAYFPQSLPGEERKGGREGGKEGGRKEGREGGEGGREEERKGGREEGRGNILVYLV